MEKFILMKPEHFDVLLSDKEFINYTTTTSRDDKLKNSKKFSDQYVNNHDCPVARAAKDAMMKGISVSSNMITYNVPSGKAHYLFDGMHDKIAKISNFLHNNPHKAYKLIIKPL